MFRQVVCVVLLSMPFLSAEFLVQPTMQSHQEIKYDVICDGNGNPVRIELWASSMQVPVIDGYAFWPDARGYMLHAWHDLNPDSNSNKAPENKPDSHSTIPDSIRDPCFLPNQPVTTKSFQCSKPKIEYTPPTRPEPFTVLYGNQTPSKQGSYIRIRTNSGSNFAPTVSSLSDKDFGNWFIAGLVYKKYCMLKYHMTPEQKNSMMSVCRYKKFTNLLLADDTLPSETVMELWDAFDQSKRISIGEDRQICLKTIKETLRARDEKASNKVKKELEAACAIKVGQIKADIDQKNLEKMKQQEAAQVQEKSRKYQAEIAQDGDYVSPYQKQREDALAQTTLQNFSEVIKTHDLDAQTEAVLHAEGIDYRKFHDLAGTVFQHQLFQEVANHYKNVAKIAFEYSIKNSCLVPQILNFAQVCFDATRMEQFDFAVKISDLAELLAETSLSICKGTIESACGLIDLVSHPKETAACIGRALVPILRTLGGAMAEYDHETSACTISMHAASDAFGSDIQAFTHIKALTEEAFFDWYSSSSGQEKVQATSKIISDFVLQPFLIGKAAKACSGLLRSAAELQTLESLSCLSSELGFADLAYDLAEITSKQRVMPTVGTLESGLTSLVESEIAVVRHGVNFAEITEIPVFIEEFSKFKGVIPATDKALVKHVDKSLKRVSKQLDQNSIKHLTQLYAQRQLGDATVYASLDHFCNPTLGLMKCKKTGDMVLNISGGHLYGACESIERAGFVKIKEIVPLPSGALHYFMEDVFTGNILEKTVVPPTWDSAKLCDAVWQLYDGAGTVKEALHGLKKTGIVDGIEFEIYYSVSKEEMLVMHKIVTCYPVGIKKG